MNKSFFCSKCGKPTTKRRLRCNLCYRKGGVPKDDYPDLIKCNLCLKEKTVDDFYFRPNGILNFYRCKACQCSKASERARIHKQKAVDYKGGKCEKCGYDKYIGALDFHHLDPKEKDFQIGRSMTYNFEEVIKPELDKCILVCANCHREIEAKHV